MDCDRDEYEKTEHMGGEIIKEDNGPVLEQGTWRTRTNQELRELYKDLDTASPPPVAQQP